jgi:hypothetical protein
MRRDNFLHFIFNRKKIAAIEGTRSRSGSVAGKMMLPKMVSYGDAIFGYSSLNAHFRLF